MKMFMYAGGRSRTLIDGRSWTSMNACVVDVLPFMPIKCFVSAHGR